MATKKRKRKSSVKRKVMSAHRSGKRRKRARKKSGLSEAFTPEGAREGAKTTVGGGIGGAATYALDAMGVRKLNGLARAGVYAGVSFIASVVLGAKNIGAGVAGAGGYSLMQTTIGGMSEMENHKFTKPGVLNEYPDAMDEAGNPMFLADDGQFYYLDEMGDDGMNLAASMQADLYPNYVNSSGF